MKKPADNTNMRITTLFTLVRVADEKGIHDIRFPFEIPKVHSNPYGNEASRMPSRKRILAGIVFVLVFATVFTAVTVRERRREACGLECLQDSLNYVKNYRVGLRHYDVEAYRKDGNVIIRMKDAAECLVAATGDGTSMIPTANPGSISIEDKCFPPQGLQVGDQIMYVDKKGGRIHHRIIRMNLTHLTTKGDHNSYEDQPIERAQYRAKVIGVVNR